MSAARLSPDQLSEALRLGARDTGSLGLRAAIHLVVFIDLPHKTRFHDRHVEIEEVGGSPAAWVVSWEDLLSDRSLRLSGGGARLLAVAASYAQGIPVNLAENGNGLGHAHARALIEAVAIGAGVNELYEIHDRPKVDEIRFHAQMAGCTR